MKILMLSPEGDDLGIAGKLADEGHEVRVWLPDERFEYASLGLLERSSNWRRDAGEWAELVFADMVGLGKSEQVLETLDVLHFGFNNIADVLELDRERQQKALRRYGVPMPETLSFDSPAQARDLAGLWTSNIKGFVLKPSGNIETGKTYVLRDKRLLDWALDQYSGDQQLVAQKFIEGVEISTEGWFNGLDWITPFNHTMEEKRFLDGGVGPNTGCMGNVVWAVQRPDRDRFVQELRKLTGLLKGARYRGPIDLNCIANAEGVWALELTVRFGYDAIEALHALMDEPLGVAFLELAMGTKTKLKLRGDFSCAVRLSVPPWPHSEPKKLDRGMPILGLAPGRQMQYLTDVYWERGQALWAASDGVVAKIVGLGDTPKAAKRQAYSNVREVRTQGLQYRTDIGDRVEADMKRLRGWGYI